MTILENLYERTLQVSMLKKENEMLRLYIRQLEEKLKQENEGDKVKCLTIRKS